MFMSTLSLVAECSLWFPSVAIVFEVFSGGGWFLPNRFFWLGCRFDVPALSKTLSIRWYIVEGSRYLLFSILIYIIYLHSGVVATSFDYSWVACICFCYYIWVFVATVRVSIFFV